MITITYNTLEPCKEVGEKSYCPVFSTAMCVVTHKKNINNMTNSKHPCQPDSRMNILASEV